MVSAMTEHSYMRFMPYVYCRKAVRSEAPLSYFNEEPMGLYW